MEKATAETIPLSLPEIKELRMGPGRRGTCMHINKSTSNARTHAHTCEAITSRSTLSTSWRGSKSFSATCMTQEAELRTAHTLISGVWNHVGCYLLWHNIQIWVDALRPRERPPAHQETETSPVILSLFNLCNLLISLLWLCDMFRLVRVSVTEGSWERGKLYSPTSNKDTSQTFQAPQEWDGDMRGAGDSRGQREEVVLCSCLWVPRTCAHKVTYHWQLKDRQFCSSLWQKRRDSSYTSHFPIGTAELVATYIKHR